MILWTSEGKTHLSITSDGSWMREKVFFPLSKFLLKALPLSHSLSLSHPQSHSHSLSHTHTLSLYSLCLQWHCPTSFFSVSFTMKCVLIVLTHYFLVFISVVHLSDCLAFTPYLSFANNVSPSYLFSRILSV